MNEIDIGRRKVGPQAAPLVIVELSGNHGGSLEKMLHMVDVAADSGAEIIKLQTYTADTMTIDLNEREFRIEDPSSLWKGQSLYQLYQKASTPWDWHKAIFDRARERGMMYMSTPFDATAVDFLESLNVPCFKIASFENTDTELIRYAASKGKPLIISTGMATVAEIEDAVRAARAGGCRDLILLKCTSSYPASPSDSHLRAIPVMAEKFQCQIGLSDHTVGVGPAIASVAMGATVIEKHFNLSRKDGAVDAEFSAEPDELKLLIHESKIAWQALGQPKIGRSEAEEASLQFRRSLYVVENVKAGEPLSRKNVRAIRPGYGLPVKHFEEILGKRAARDIPRGTALSWELV